MCDLQKSFEDFVPPTVDPLTIPQHLPIGRTQFEEWSDRIIKYAEVEADVASQKFMLADAIIHLPAGKCIEIDGYFVFLLRRMAINQTVIEMKNELKAEHDRKVAEEKAKEEASKE